MFKHFFRKSWRLGDNAEKSMVRVGKSTDDSIIQRMFCMLDN
jgi:hypothetical protein